MKTFLLLLIICLPPAAFAQGATMFGQNNSAPQPNLYWESDYGVTGSPASAWIPRVGAITLSQGTAGSRPTVTASAFGATTGLTFDGSADLMTHTGQAITRTGSASLAVVFKTGASVTGPFVLVAQADSAASNDYWEFGINASGKLYVSSNATGTTLTIEGSTVLSTATAYNAILCYDGTDYYLELDGIEENPLVITSEGAFAWLGRVAAGTPVFSAGAVVLSGGTTRYFNGTLGGIWFWNYDLTR